MKETAEEKAALRGGGVTCLVLLDVIVAQALCADDALQKREKERLLHPG